MMRTWRVAAAMLPAVPALTVPALTVLVFTVLVFTVPAPVAAQDVEMRAQGRALPPGYWEQIRRKPDFFEIDHGWTARLSPDPLTASAVGGTLPVLVVQALFADSPEPDIDPADIRRVLFDGPAPHGTLTEHYREMSRGALTVTGVVTPWVRTAITRADAVGPSYGLGLEANTGTFLMQALELIDPTVDMGLFDNDGPDGVPNSGDDDGFVDVVAFQFLEQSAACGGDGIWPHRAGLANWHDVGRPFESRTLTPSGQPIKVNGYIVQSSVDCTGPYRATVIAHELGHVFALPDLYHAVDGLLPSQRRWLVGCWSLMSAGAWGCGDGAAFGTALRPTHMGPWEKLLLGWLDHEIVGPAVRDREFVLPPVQTSGRALLVRLTGQYEYLLIEYRPAIGFDVELPASGVLIYHIDLSIGRFPTDPAAPRLYPVTLVEADGDGALLRTALEGGNRGVAGDAWAVGSTASLSSTTSPALYRTNGTLTTVTINSIAIDVAGGVARVRVSTAATPGIVEGLVIQPATLSVAFAHRVRAAGGALPYNWSVAGSLPDGIASRVSGDALFFEGTPSRFGTFDLTASITDALGTTVQQPLTLTVLPGALSLDRLIQPFVPMGASALAPEEEAWLDQTGNGNGVYDIGDLRRQIRALGL